MSVKLSLMSHHRTKGYQYCWAQVVEMHSIPRRKREFSPTSGLHVLSNSMSPPERTFD